MNIISYKLIVASGREGDMAFICGFLKNEQETEVENGKETEVENGKETEVENGKETEVEMGKKQNRHIYSHFCLNFGVCPKMRVT